MSVTNNPSWPPYYSTRESPNLDFKALDFVGYWLPSSRDTTALAQINKNQYEESRLMLINRFRDVFGSIHTDTKFDHKIVTSLMISAAKDPDGKINHNTYEAPNGWFAKWKWLTGIDNTLDQKVQTVYNEKNALLETVKTESIIQLRNKMVAFWHTDRQLNDYNRYKGAEIARAQSTRIGRFIFKFLSFICGAKPFMPTLKPVSLNERSKQTYAAIGGFTLNGKEYEVRAWHPLKSSQAL